MSVTPSSAIVGVFRDQATAEQATDALYNAGFTHEQVRRSAPENSSGFFEELKNLFTGSNSGSGDVTSDLTGMGISEEEAQYYAHEQSNGNTIIAVHAPGREQEAQAIMHQYGAYSAPDRTENLSQNTTSATHDTTLSDTPVQHTDTSPTQDTPPSIEEQSSQDMQHSVNFVLVPDSDQPEQASQTYTEQAGSDPYHQEATHMTPDTTQSPGSDETVGTYVPDSGSPDYTDAEQDAQPLVVDYSGSELHSDTQDSSIQNQTSQPEASTYSIESDNSQPVITDDTTYVDDNTSASELQTTYPAEETPIVNPTSAEPEEPQYATDTRDVQPLATNTTMDQPVGDVSNADTEPLAAHAANTDSSVTDNQDVQNTSFVTNTDVVEPQTELSPIVTDTTDNTVTPEAFTSPVTTPESAPSSLPSSPSVSSTADTDDLQQLQTQFVALQQQLQDVQAQLQAAREQEEHLRTAKERQQQIETLRQQMQALQAELAAAQAELQDTHARIGQYQ